MVEIIFPKVDLGGRRKKAALAAGACVTQALPDESQPFEPMPLAEQPLRFFNRSLINLPPRYSRIRLYSIPEVDWPILPIRNDTTDPSNENANINVTARIKQIIQLTLKKIPAVLLPELCIKSRGSSCAVDIKKHIPAQIHKNQTQFWRQSARKQPGISRRTTSKARARK